MKVTLLTNQISHYHNARYAAFFSGDIHGEVLVVGGDFDFDELRANTAGSYVTASLLTEKDAYARALATGSLRSTLHQALSNLNSDVVVVPGWSRPECIEAISWARNAGRRVVMLSESQYGDAPRHFIRECIKSRVVRGADAALVGGRPHMRYAIRLGLPAPGVFLGYDAVDNEHFARGAAAARESADVTRQQHQLPKRYLLASGRFIPKKNLAALVRAYALAVKDTENPAALLILGDGQERSRVEEAIEKCNLSHLVTLRGFEKYENLPALYGLADAFIHVAYREQWGLVINEAMASGIPVIVSKACGATSELLREGVNGFAINPHSLTDISERISCLLAMSPLERSKMGNASALIVAQWGPARFGDELKRACEYAVKQKQRRLSPIDRLIYSRLSARVIAGVD